MLLALQFLFFVLSFYLALQTIRIYEAQHQSLTPILGGWWQYFVAEIGGVLRYAPFVFMALMLVFLQGKRIDMALGVVLGLVAAETLLFVVASLRKMQTKNRAGSLWEAMYLMVLSVVVFSLLYAERLQAIWGIYLVLSYPVFYAARWWLSAQHSYAAPDREPATELQFYRFLSQTAVFAAFNRVLGKLQAPARHPLIVFFNTLVISALLSWALSENLLAIARSLRQPGAELSALLVFGLSLMVGYQRYWDALRGAPATTIGRSGANLMLLMSVVLGAVVALSAGYSATHALLTVDSELREILSMLGGVVLLSSAINLIGTVLERMFLPK